MSYLENIDTVQKELIELKDDDNLSKIADLLL